MTKKISFCNFCFNNGCVFHSNKSRTIKMRNAYKMSVSVIWRSLVTIQQYPRTYVDNTNILKFLNKWIRSRTSFSFNVRIRSYNTSFLESLSINSLLNRNKEESFEIFSTIFPVGVVQNMNVMKYNNETWKKIWSCAKNKEEKFAANNFLHAFL